MVRFAEIFFALLLAMLIVLGFQKVYKISEIRYNCDLAEISPDFPKEVKQKCRELRNENRRM
jgi:hypothetical protein